MSSEFFVQAYFSDDFCKRIPKRERFALPRSPEVVLDQQKTAIGGFLLIRFISFYANIYQFSRP
jgi:hypothetical protein